MQFLRDISERVGHLSDKDFYRYFGAGLGGVILIAAIIIYWSRSSEDGIRKNITNINEQREELKSILEMESRVATQRDQVNKVLQGDPDFKLGGSLKEILDKIGFSQKDTVALPDLTTVSDREDSTYNEVQATIRLAGISMKQLTELLQAIEQHERLFNKELDITRSKKIAGAIDVMLVIGSLELKALT